MMAGDIAADADLEEHDTALPVVRKKLLIAFLRRMPAFLLDKGIVDAQIGSERLCAPGAARQKL